MRRPLSNLSKANALDRGDYIEANAHRLPHTGSKYVPSYAGRLIHTDIAGPFDPSHVTGSQYILLLVDDHTRWKRIFHMRARSQALTYFQLYVEDFNEYGTRAKGAAPRV